MKLEDLNKARYIIHLIKEYKYFLEVKHKCWDDLLITKKETSYILKTAYGFLKKDLLDNALNTIGIQRNILKRLLISKKMILERWSDGIICTLF